MVGPMRVTMIVMLQSLPVRVATLSWARWLSPQLLLLPTQLTLGEPPSSRSRDKLPNPEGKLQRILNDTESSVDIITCGCLQKLTYPGRDIVPLVHPILGFGGQEVNPTGMICLLLHFGDRLKPRNLESTSSNEKPVAPTRHGATKEKIKDYNVRLPPVVWGPHLAIQRCGSLMLVPLARRWDKLHLLRIPAFGLGLLALLHVVKVGLKVTVLLEVRGQCHQYHTEELHTLLTAPLVAKLLGLGRLLERCSGLGLSLRKSSLGLGERHLFPAALVPGRSLFQLAALRHGLHRPSKSLQSDSHDITKGRNTKAKNKDEGRIEYVPPTLTTATSSSVTLRGSEVPEMATSHDLASS
ncbi:hypothetical protein Cgig2_014989 [Carnegiea gigantea]|uniref:Secreted protein n=1 Tax=Carnegiea gigantea TaxID=171969 RepID=A0A9Q1KJN5_9CARY|nr:hypothetical protein Cgig2_014989 [Carnegiea gigantea]